MAIKMRVNSKPNCKCTNCGTEFMYTPELVDIKVSDSMFTLCKKCQDELFHKLLKISVLYNSRVKTKQDMQRIRNANKLSEPESKGLSVSEALRGFKIKED